MKHNNDILIEHNLNILAKDKDLRKGELKDLNNNKLDKANCLVLLNELETNGLIILDNMNRLILTTEAEHILNNGGWIKKIEIDNKNKEAELTKTELKEQLEIELKVLQKEGFEYQKTIRKQTDRIRNLEEQIKFISLIKLYWWFIPTCITIGIFLREFWDLIKL